jgi:hypothetical protein
VPDKIRMPNSGGILQLRQAQAEPWEGDGQRSDRMTHWKAKWAVMLGKVMHGNAPLCKDPLARRRGTRRTGHNSWQQLAATGQQLARSGWGDETVGLLSLLPTPDRLSVRYRLQPHLPIGWSSFPLLHPAPARPPAKLHTAQQPGRVPFLCVHDPHRPPLSRPSGVIVGPGRTGVRIWNWIWGNLYSVGEMKWLQSNEMNWSKHPPH